ncbi:MAG TPA: dicarboxylate/amino acid:cation symporter, partial [Steroidobacteraceae bacterium]|nr:dicarboxylate/amino acid:cation symporter [Steroidobacteraceae bacterium]
DRSRRRFHGGNMRRGAIWRSLYVQVLVAIALGIALGVFFPHFAQQLKPLGDGFIKLIRLLIAPIIFCTVVTGIAGMAKLREVGKAGGLALLYFEVVSTIALFIGLVIVNLVKPGAGVNADPATLDPHAVAQYTTGGALPGFTDFVLNVIPTTFFGAFASGDVLQVLLIAILFGFALHAAGGRDRRLYALIEEGGEVLFRIVGYLMRLAPLGALGAMAFTVGRYGAESLLALVRLMGCFYLTCVLFVLGVLGLIARLHGFSVLRFIRYIREELFIVLGTSSSETVLPRMLHKMEDLGVRKPIVGLVIPAGYSFNLDGTSIYLTMAAIYVAQATNTPLDLTHQLTLLAVLLLTSKGAAAVTGGGFITLAASLSAVGHVPVTGLALILGIDRFMSEARALTNLVGNGVATIVVGKWCGQVDEARLQAGLGGRAGPQLPEPSAP